MNDKLKSLINAHVRKLNDVRAEIRVLSQQEIVLVNKIELLKSMLAEEEGSDGTS